MRSSDEVKQFRRLGQKLFHGRFWDFMSGFKSIELKTYEQKHCNYSQIHESNTNFAVPANTVIAGSSSSRLIIKPDDIVTG